MLKALEETIELVGLAVVVVVDTLLLNTQFIDETEVSQISLR